VLRGSYSPAFQSGSQVYSGGPTPGPPGRSRSIRLSSSGSAVPAPSCLPLAPSLCSSTAARVLVLEGQCPGIRDCLTCSIMGEPSIAVYRPFGSLSPGGPEPVETLPIAAPMSYHEPPPCW
jgi:hypothetical protein